MRKYKDIITHSVWDYVREHIEVIGITSEEFQKRVGFDDGTMYQLISGDLKLLPAQAAKLEILFGISFQTWLNLDQIYHENVERIENLMREDEENPARKAVLLAIHPFWSGLILDGIKTLEIRKGKPKLEPPFRVYQYETLRGFGRGMIVGEWVCDKIIRVVYGEGGAIDFDARELVGAETCLSPEDFLAYSDGNIVFGWRAAIVKRYDEPLPLSVFGLRRPPQSWGYVEEIGGGH